MVGYIRVTHLVVGALLLFVAWSQAVAGPEDVGQSELTARLSGRLTHLSARGLAGVRQMPDGTGAVVAQAQAPFRLKHLGIFRVTAYSDSTRNGTDGRGITRTGERTRWGVVAVDPAVIPLRSSLMIEGMDSIVFSALDTGGRIVGRRVDIWFPTDREALEHGVKELGVYLVVR